MSNWMEGTHRPPEGKVDETNPKDALGSKKPDLSLVPPASLIYQAKAMEDGARKYGPYNWRNKKVRARVYVAAALRHLECWLDGEDDASDSNVSHLGHALASVGIIADALETGNLIDDRPEKGAASRLLGPCEGSGDKISWPTRPTLCGKNNCRNPMHRRLD